MRYVQSMIVGVISSLFHTYIYIRAECVRVIAPDFQTPSPQPVSCSLRGHGACRGRPLPRFTTIEHDAVQQNTDGCCRYLERAIESIRRPSRRPPARPSVDAGNIERPSEQAGNPTSGLVDWSDNARRSGWACSTINSDQQSTCRLTRLLEA